MIDGAAVRCIGPGQAAGRNCDALLIELLDGRARVTCDRCHWVNEVDTAAGEHWIKPPHRRLTESRTLVMMAGRNR